MPVGRIEWLYMYPMSFIEFLYAYDQGILAETILNHHSDQPISEAIHNLALALLGEYLAIGGMPAAVKCWVTTKDIFGCARLLQAIKNTYRKDFDKYAKKRQIKYVDLLFNYIPKRLGRKFKYSEVSPEYKKRELEPALELLVMAGIVTKVLRSSGQGIPLGAQASDQDFKVIFLDIALSQVVLGLDIGTWIVNPSKQLLIKVNLLKPL
jgi:predicted AAA+ superfamily ATPase